MLGAAADTAGVSERGQQGQEHECGGRHSSTPGTEPADGKAVDGQAQAHSRALSVVTAVAALRHRSSGLLT